MGFPTLLFYSLYIMDIKGLEIRIKELISPVISSMGMDIDNVELKKWGGSFF